MHLREQQKNNVSQFKIKTHFIKRNIWNQSKLFNTLVGAKKQKNKSIIGNQHKFIQNQKEKKKINFIHPPIQTIKSQVVRLVSKILFKLRYNIIIF